MSIMWTKRYFPLTFLRRTRFCKCIQPQFIRIQAEKKSSFFRPSGLTVTCKNCSLEGNVILNKGSFEISEVDGFMDAVNNTIAFFDHGSIEVIANGLFAQVELEFDLSASQDLVSVTAQLPAIPLIPFEVCSLRRLQEPVTDV